MSVLGLLVALFVVSTGYCVHQMSPELVWGEGVVDRYRVFVHKPYPSAILYISICLYA
jgi:hypothetical protein